jgi:hypothetical protein
MSPRASAWALIQAVGMSAKRVGRVDDTMIAIFGLAMFLLPCGV